MVDKLRHRLDKEKLHWKKLGHELRRLLVSYALFLCAWPMVVTFVNTYLWHQGEDIRSLISYNLLFFVGLPVGFYLNKIILMHMHVLKVYWLGAVLQGLSAIMVVFARPVGLTGLMWYGAFFGVGSGLYWANKNYLSYKLSRGKNRIYYNAVSDYPGAFSPRQ